MKNSVLKHLDNKEIIKQRMELVVQEIKKLCKKVKELSKSAAKFIRRASNSAITFVRVCYEKGKLIPWNNNRIESLMGELSKRIKHKWMHWSPKGLEAIANLILIRCCERGGWNEFKDEYVRKDRNDYVPIGSITIKSVRRNFDPC